MLEKIHIIITLFGALIMTIVCMIFHVDFFSLCISVIIVIIVFFFIGLYLRTILRKIFSEDDIENMEDVDDNIDEDPEFDDTDDLINED